jgi:hypothetical protein
VEQQRQTARQEKDGERASAQQQQQHSPKTGTRTETAKQQKDGTRSAEGRKSKTRQRTRRRPARRNSQNTSSSGGQEPHESGKARKSGNGARKRCPRGGSDDRWQR